MDEKEFPENYQPSVVEVLKALSLTGDGKNIRVIGSASLRRIQYAGDYDANEVTDEHISVIAGQLGEVIRRLKKIPLLVIGDIKLGEKDGEPIRWTPGEIEKGDGLEEALRTGGRAKIDTMAVVESGRYVEIGCVYLYGRETKPPDEKDLQRDLEIDMEEQVKDKNYWKALKRLFSIARLTGEMKRIERLTEIFNGDMGRLYSIISDIKVIEYLLDNTTLSAAQKKVLEKEIEGFKYRISNIWDTPEFIKAEPGFIKTIDKAADAPAKALPVLRRLMGKFEAILQGEAKEYLYREVSSTGKK